MLSGEVVIDSSMVLRSGRRVASRTALAKLQEDDSSDDEGGAKYSHSPRWAPKVARRGVPHAAAASPLAPENGAHRSQSAAPVVLKALPLARTGASDLLGSLDLMGDDVISESKTR